MVQVPGGSAFEVLQPGDVLLRAGRAGGEGRASCWCTSFLQVEELLDESVGTKVCLAIERGGKEIGVTLEVGDLHALSPTSVQEVGGCCFHSLSFQQARNWNMPPGAVYTAFAGYMLSNAGVPCRAVVKELNNKRTADFDSFLKVLLTLHDGARVPLRYALPYSQHQERLAVITIERTWFACVR